VKKLLLTSSLVMLLAALGAAVGLLGSPTGDRRRCLAAWCPSPRSPGARTPTTRTGRILWQFDDGRYSPVTTWGDMLILTGKSTLYGMRTAP
jgi:hypothetical protein